MTDKIAFLFLTRGEHNNVSLWEKFFVTADPKKYRIIIHPKETSLLTSPLWTHPNSSILRPIPTAWGSITLVKATLYLIQMSLIDPSVKKFVLVSESCIPTNNFNSVYETAMLEIGRSRIHWTYGKNIDRYTMIKSGLPPTITPNNWMKQSQWMILDRKHVQLLFQPNLQSRFTQFLQNFQYCPVPDEHFFINYFVHILKLHPNEFINHPVTFVDWNSNSKHPKLFAFLPREIIQLCRDNKIFFARKFAPLQLTLTDINYILDIKEPVKLEPIVEPKEEAKIEPKIEPKVETVVQPKVEVKVEPVLDSDSESDVEEEEEVKEVVKEQIEDIILSVEERAIVEYFSGTLIELKKIVVKLTPKQISSIYSSLFTKPPTLLIDSDSDSESEESEEPVNQLEVIVEEPEDNLSEDSDITEEPILPKEVKEVKEEVVSPNISLEEVEEVEKAEQQVEKAEEVVSPNISLEEVEQVEQKMESVKVVEPSPEVILEELVNTEPEVIKEEVTQSVPELVLEEPDNEVVKTESAAELFLEESVETEAEVVKEVEVKLEDSDEVEIQLEEPETIKVEPKKVIQPKNQNMKKGKKGN